MTTVVVAGSSSRAGKTALAETDLRGLGGRPAAVKFTTTDDVFEKCPRGTACIVCDIDVPFKVVRDDPTLGESGTDTARLQAATGGPVLWTIARKSVAALAWEATLRLLDLARADAKGFTVREGLVTAIPWTRPRSIRGREVVVLTTWPRRRTLRSRRTTR